MWNIEYVRIEKRGVLNGRFITFRICILHFNNYAAKHNRRKQNLTQYVVFICA